MNLTFSEVKSRIQKLFPFKIALKSPYKLCDYKPVYGVVFEEYFKDYDFWGYADLDLVFGDLRSFLTENVLNRYDKIYHQAHLSLYRNCEAMNTLYLHVLPEGKAFDYKFVYRTEHPCFFDEHCGIERIAKYENIRMYTWKMGLENGVLADIVPFSKKFSFRMDHGELDDVFFEYRYGKLYLCSQEERIPAVYAHFAKRQFEIETMDTDCFNIVPNSYVQADEKYPTYTETELSQYKKNFARNFRNMKIKRAFKLGILKYIQKVIRKRKFMPLE